jgi:hypothetical protein
MRRLRPSASAVALVLLSLVASSLPRDAGYAHRHDGDAHGHVHVTDGSHVGRSRASVRDFLGHAHDHDHAPHGDHAHSRPNGSAAEHAHADDGGERHAEDPSSVARAASDRPSFTAAAGGLHAHWQAPFQASAITTVQYDAPSSVRRIPRFPAPIAASVERALALRARAPPVSPV